MHAVLGLIKYLGLRAAEYLVGNFHLGQTEFLVDVSADSCLQVMERGQAVQEDGARVGILHNSVDHLIRAEQLDAFLMYSPVETSVPARYMEAPIICWRLAQIIAFASACTLLHSS